MSGSRPARVVVTGARGFIGTHLVRRLRAERIPVVAVVRTGSSNDALALGATVIVRDLASDRLDDVIEPGDRVVHLAARAHVMHEKAGDAEAAYWEANVEPTRRLCRSAAARGARRVLLLSSAKVFGEEREEPYTRTDPMAPADAYARSKVAAEEVVRATASGGGIEWTIMRPPFVYGLGGKGNFPRLLALARLSSVLPLPLASIQNRRSLLFVGNLVDAIVRCGFQERAAGEVLLPTDQCDVSTPELLRAVAAARSARARLFPFPPSLLRAAAKLVGRAGEVDRLTESLRLDSAHMTTEFGWHAPYTLDDALALSTNVPQAASRASAP